MIPKIIHYVWLSGDEKPQLIKDCIESWKRVMPDYEIREWTMSDIMDIQSDFLKGALAARKWAFCTDYLRFHIIYHYGGIYMDSDVFVFKSFDDLLDCNGFTSLEGSGVLFPESKNKLQDFGLEAAVFGAVKGCEWIKLNLDHYKDLKFVNTQKFLKSIIAPKVMWNCTLPLGLRKVPSFQQLKGNVKIYPLDTLSCIADFSLYGLEQNDYSKISEINPLKYSCHLCNNSWGWKPPFKFSTWLKNTIIKMIGAQNAVGLKRNVKRIIHKA